MTPLTEIFGLPVDQGVSGRWIFDRIENWARREPQRRAFVLDRDGKIEEYTYLDVVQSANRVAALLEARGIRRGDRVGILMENVPHWVFALLGVLRIGGVVVPLATALSETGLRGSAPIRDACLFSWTSKTRAGPETPASLSSSCHRRIF
jgi:acyl-CoA synthetase (AMP-forming)/AMP-acid ligase II